MKIDWKRKLASRKFWGLIGAAITANLVLFGISEETTVQVVATIGAYGTVIVYILSEGAIDKEREKNNLPK